MVFKWTDKAVKLMRSVIKNNGSAQIAADAINKQLGMDITRNAVVGKCHRMGIRLNSKNIVSRRKKPVEDAFTWRGKPIHHLIDSWNNGQKTIEIAYYFKTTQGTIRKKVMELGLTPRNRNKIARENTIKTRLRHKPKTKRPVNQPPARKYTGFPNPDAIGVTFMDLQRFHCRYPIGTGGDDPYIYCGATVSEGSSLPYCDVCKRVMYIPSKYQVASHVKE